MFFLFISWFKRVICFFFNLHEIPSTLSEFSFCILSYFATNVLFSSLILMPFLVGFLCLNLSVLKNYSFISFCLVLVFFGLSFTWFIVLVDEYIIWRSLRSGLCFWNLWREENEEFMKFWFSSCLDIARWMFCD